jgi:hypothetical protein
LALISQFAWCETPWITSRQIFWLTLIHGLLSALSFASLLRVAAHGLSAKPLSILCVRRLEGAKEPPVERTGMFEPRQRWSVLAEPPRKSVSQAKRSGYSSGPDRGPEGRMPSAAAVATASRRLCTPSFW